MDEETKKEWEKSKRIDEERMKAVRDLDATAESKANLAYLDPKPTRLKGFERGEHAIMMSTERLANISAAVLVGGILITLIVRGILGSGFSFGLAMGYAIMIIQTLGSILLAVAVVTSVASLLASLYYYIKYHKKSSGALWTAGIVAVILIIYYIVDFVIF